MTDLIIETYLKQLHAGSHKEFVCLDEEMEEHGQVTDLQIGWAVKGDRKSVRLNEKFDMGVNSGRKEDPLVVSEEMRHTKLSNGKRRFTIAEFLSPQQITSYFSRLTRNKKSLPLDEDYVAAQKEETLQKLCEIVGNI